MESLYTCFALRYGDEDVFQTCALDAQRGKSEVLLISDRDHVFGQRIGIISIKAPLVALPFLSDHEAAPFYCAYVDGFVKRDLDGLGLFKRLFEPLRRCLLYTSPSPRDGLLSRMPSSA